MTNTPQPAKQAELDFSGLNVDSQILAVLGRLKFHTPTPIQYKSIPTLLEGKDMIGIAQTGTGKTLAFGIPMVQRLIRFKGKGLILLPTRELAIQVDQELQKIGAPFRLKTAVLIGGAPMGRQVRDIKNGAHIFIGTPGRIIDHIQQKTISLHDVRILVLDEADRMLDMGFAPQIKQILNTVPKERQTMLFSATMPDDIVKIATTHMKLPIRVEIARSGTVSQRVDQEVFIVEKNQKAGLLQFLLGKYEGTILVFSRTKHGAKKICRDLRNIGHSAAEIHSNRSLSQRQEALQGFKNGKYRILVATDIAARGIDVKDIEVVINYDIPEQAEDYVHRIGRTGREGKAGRAITFASADQNHKIRPIEKLIRAALKVSPLPHGLPVAKKAPPSAPAYSRAPYKHARPSSSRKPPGRRHYHAFR